MAKFFRFPFGTTGDRAAIPDAVQVDGTVSYQEGYPDLYSADTASDPDALSIERTKWNQLMYDITGAIRQYQIAGVPDFIASGDNGGMPFSYGKNARVLWNNGSSIEVYESLSDSNTTDPSNAAGWVQISGKIGLSRLADIAGNTVVANASGASGAPSALSVGLNTILGRAGGNLSAISMAASRLLGRKATGDIVPLTLSEILDLVGSAAQGDVLFRGATAWKRLPVGAAGSLLASAGAGADLLWAAAAGGKIGQVFHVSKTSTFTTTSTSFVDVTGLSQTLTPASANSKFLIIADLMADGFNAAFFQMAGGNAGNYIGDTGGTARAMAGFFTNSTSIISQGTKVYLDAPATALALTYKVQMRVAGGTGYLNRTNADNYARFPSSLTIIEILP